MRQRSGGAPEAGRPSLHDELLDLLGERKFRRLVDRFGGRVIRIPTTVRETRARRKARVLEELRSRSYRAAAQVLGVSRSTVERDSGV